MDDVFLEATRQVAQTLALPPDYTFNAAPVVPVDDFHRLTDVRVTDPGLIHRALADRPRRSELTTDGRLVILAADHPARMVVSVASDPIRMADRADYLARIVRVLATSAVDGLMATPDVVEDIVLLDHFARSRGEQGFLGHRLLIGSMNRSGLQGAAHELFDLPSAWLSAKDLVAANLDGAKILWRYIAHADHSRDSVETMIALAHLAADVTDAGLPLFIEPLAMEYRFEKLVVSKVEADWVRIIGAATSIGPTTAGVWIKIPFLRPYHRICAATTLPILMLGGPSTGIPASLLIDFAEGMGAAHNVRGALVGRNILYPGPEDPAVIARAVCHLVHDQMGALEAAGAASQSPRL